MQYFAAATALILLALRGAWTIHRQRASRRTASGAWYGHPVVSPAQALQHPYPYVFINADGSVRELEADERAYL
jgi:hypothetical protein